MLTWRSAVLGIACAAVTALLFGAISSFFLPWGLPAMTLPFCFGTLAFVLLTVRRRTSPGCHRPKSPHPRSTCAAPGNREAPTRARPKGINGLDHHKSIDPGIRRTTGPLHGGIHALVLADGNAVRGSRTPIFGSDQRLSRRGFVLVDQSAEDRSAPDPAIDRLGDKRFRTRRTQLQRSMWPPRVVMHGVPGKYPAKVLLAEDQHPVGEFGADGQYEAFSEAVRPRTARRDFDNLDTGIASTASNEAVNCPARSRTRNRNRPTCWPRSMMRLRPAGWPRARRDAR